MFYPEVAFRGVIVYTRIESTFCKQYAPFQCLYLFFSCRGLIVLSRAPGLRQVEMMVTALLGLFLTCKENASQISLFSIWCPISWLIERLSQFKRIFVYSWFLKSQMDAQYYQCNFLHQLIYETFVFILFRFLL